MFMEPDRPPENPEPLRKLMREWKVTKSLPPRFQEGVWKRIERAQAADSTPSVWVVIAHWISTVLPRPALATAYVAALLALGVTVGWTKARQENARVKDELSQRYVRVLDPYLTPRQ